MFLDQKLKNIRATKNNLVTCCDLRRCLVQIEVQDVWRGVRRTFSNLTLGVAAAKQIFSFLRERKGSR